MFLEELNFDGSIMYYKNFHGITTNKNNIEGKFSLFGHTIYLNFYFRDNELILKGSNIFFIQLDDIDCIINNQDDYDIHLLDKLGIAINNTIIDANRISLICTNNHLVSKPKSTTVLASDIVKLAKMIKGSTSKFKSWVNILNKEMTAVLIKDYIEYDHGGSDGYGEGPLVIKNIKNFFFVLLRAAIIKK